MPANRGNGSTPMLLTHANKKWEKHALEKLFEVFPVLSEAIFGQLDDKHMAKCKKIIKEWYNYLENHKMYWARMIKRLTKDCHKDWKKVVHKSVPLDYLKKLIQAILEHYYEKSAIKNLLKKNSLPLDFG